MVRKIFFISIPLLLLFFAAQIVVQAKEYAKEKKIIVIDPDKTGAVVEQIKGVSVFILSVPKEKYNYLGTVKKSFAISGSNDEMINGIVSKAKKEYPECDAVLFNTLEFERGDVIKFKQ